MTDDETPKPSRRVSLVPVVLGLVAAGVWAWLAFLESEVKRPSTLLVQVLVAPVALWIVCCFVVLATGRKRVERRPWSVPLAHSLVVLFAAGGVALAIPNLLYTTVNDSYAPYQMMRKVSEAQSRFRESDKEADGNLDYGSLEELRASGLLYPFEGWDETGQVAGYIYETSYSSSTSEFLWFATGRPLRTRTLEWYEEPGTYDRYYATNHEGVLYYTTTAPFSLNTTSCEIPHGAVPHGFPMGQR